MRRLAQLITSLMGENNNKTKQTTLSVILLQRRGFAWAPCVVCAVSAGCRHTP